mmetsp:Transcript_44249/g.83051  ORF Transcript_44249/g.83051 Transcript_44249/m.83051 type:complete len:104 (+) Transcript_44249:580-891(+)
MSLTMSLPSLGVTGRDACTELLAVVPVPDEGTIPEGSATPACCGITSHSRDAPSGAPAILVGAPLEEKAGSSEISDAELSDAGCGLDFWLVPPTLVVCVLPSQ